jgi:hypothetical protein
MKAGVAAEAVGEGAIKEKLLDLQNRQVKNLSIDGDWLVLVDKSGSMDEAIETGRYVAALLTAAVSGDVHMVFFDNAPRGMQVTGKSFEEISKITKSINANGGTSIGCALQWALEANVEAHGIVVFTDGGENAYPYFFEVYQKYAKKYDREVPVYFYWVWPRAMASNFHGYALQQEAGRFERSLQNIPYTKFDLRGGVDYYSLPNLVQTMRTNRFSLVDEIYATPLLTMTEALKPAWA